MARGVSSSITNDNAIGLVGYLSEGDGPQCAATTRDEREAWLYQNPEALASERLGCSTCMT